MYKVLIVHPEGNINNNPNLYEILRLLSSNDFKVDVYLTKKDYQDQKSYFQNVEILFNKDGSLEKELNYGEIIATIPTKKYDIILGVDRGIILAAEIANKSNTPYALISYELYFLDEIGQAKKEREIKACAGISFALIQDPLRGFVLSRENHIDSDKLLYIPLAGKIGSPGKSEYLRTYLNIPKQKKIVLFAGSLTDWSMFDDIIQNVSLWPDDWVLVVHGRYGITNKLRRYLKRKKNIYVSLSMKANPDEMQDICSSADYGIALYRFNTTSFYEGKNLAFIGLSSGKIATYLCNGLPVIVNDLGTAGRLIQDYNAGHFIQDIRQLPEKLRATHDKEELRKNAVRLFNERYSFNLYEDSFLAAIRSAIKNEKTPVKNVGLNHTLSVNEFDNLYSQYIYLFGEYSKLIKRQKKFSFKYYFLYCKKTLKKVFK